MPNVQFNYRYRDAANYKKHGYAIFANPQNFAIAELETLIKSKLIDETYFYAEQWHLPELFLKTCDFRFDPTWHEFESLEYTDSKAKRYDKLEGLMELVKKTNWRY